jgi:hypothetical protein
MNVNTIIRCSAALRAQNVNLKGMIKSIFAAFGGRSARMMRLSSARIKMRETQKSPTK